MMFVYSGYYLTIFPNKEVPGLIYGECPEAKFFYIEESYDATIKAFKEHIDNIKEENKHRPTIEQLLEENKQLKQQIKDLEYQIVLAEGRIW